MTGASTVTLLYHSVFDAEDTGESYDVNVEAFNEHLRIIRGTGVRCVSTGDLLAPEGQPGEAARQAILTFDDGREDNYEIVFPILVGESLGAAFFVNPSRVGNRGFMDWSSLRELARHGMSIQSHGMTHRYLHDLDRAELEGELKGSKHAIEDRIGMPVDFLSVPGGFHSRRMIEAAWSFGYRGIFTSDPGVDRIDRPVRAARLHRYNISRTTSREEVGGLLSQNMALRFRHLARHAIKTGARTVLGTDGYHRIWTRLRKYSR